MNHPSTLPTPSFVNASGEIPYNMTNDYMFRAVLQKNKKVLAGLVGSLLHLDPETLDVEIANPIILGESIDDKTFVLDVEVTVNRNTHLDLEMQVINYGNWKERSLSYLCRSFDSLTRGANYIDLPPAAHIGFIDFSLFEDAPEFYATYKMQNVKNHRIYTDKMWLSVVELNSIELATEEDRLYRIDQWAKLFKAKTWEELKAMATTNQYMESAANTMYELSADRMVKEQCRRRAEYERFQKYQAEENARKDALIADQKAVIADQKAVIAGKDALITDQKAVIKDKDTVIADQKAVIEDLKRMLADVHRK